MFDGNHRVSRREVNLSGKRKNGNKQALLNESRQRREARRIATARAAAATRLQARQRGNKERKRLFDSWMEQFQRACQHTQQEDTVTPVLDTLVALSLHAARYEVVSDLLPKYASVVRNHKSSSLMCARRVVDITLENAKRLEFDDFQGILSYLLHFNDDEDDSMEVDDESTLWMHRAGASFDSLAIDLLCREPSRSPMQIFLRQCISKILPASVEKDAVSFVLSVAFDDVRTQDSNVLQSQFTALHNLMTTPSPTNVRLYNIALKLIAKNSVKILSTASNLFLQTDPTISVAVTLVTLFHESLMTDWVDSDPVDRSIILWAMNRITRGDDLEVVVELSKDVMEEDESDSDNDDEEPGPVTNMVATSTAVSRRIQRQEFQTIAKLDRSFQNLTHQVDQWYAGNFPRLQHGVERLADATLWHRLGVVILTQGNESQKDVYVVLLATILQSLTSSTSNSNTLSSQLLNKLSFSLEFMEGLWSFVSTKKERLLDPRTWPASFVAGTSVFASVVSHYLVALRDEQFVSRHTAVKTATSGIEERPSVPVLDILELYNELLCDLYMKNPVTQSDFGIVLRNHLTDRPLTCSGICTSQSELPALRAQAMLNGTKLWTSLYSRWSRLIASARFCEESTWWFDETLATDGSIRNEDSNDMEIDDDHGELATSFRDPKVARLLSAIPMVVPFEHRVGMFQSLLSHDKTGSQNALDDAAAAIEAMMRGEEPRQSSRLKIHRDKLFEDSMEQLNALGRSMKQKIQVSFVNRHGAEEAGIDGGGVFREFIDDLINEAFLSEDSTERPILFSVTPHETLSINTDLDVSALNLARFEFLGRVLGKALYESIVVEPQFCLPFLNQLLGKSNSLDDLKNLDAEYYSNLTKLLTMPENDLEGLGLVFEANAGSTVSSRSIELVANGKRKPVTKQNVISYVHLVANFKLNIETNRQTKAFLRGFRDLIPGSWVRLFSAHELQKLISGDDSLKGFDVEALKKSMQYAAGYHPDQPIIQWFWEVVSELTTEQKHLFLKFMTSCSRQPLLGFGSLEPAPCVQQIRLPETMFQGDMERTAKLTPLPTSSTCMNLLKMPNYRSKELLKQKLLAAIESGAGFELT